MDIERFSRRMIELMPQLIRGCAKHEHNSLTRGEITVPQLWALESLARQEACPMHEMAQQLEISRPSATQLIDRLIHQGFVTRQHDPSDRRVVRVLITAKGRKVLQDIWEQKRRTLVKVFSQLSAAERSQYLATLERVVDILSNEQTAQPRAARSALPRR